MTAHYKIRCSLLTDDTISSSVQAMADNHSVGFVNMVCYEGRIVVINLQVNKFRPLIMIQKFDALLCLISTVHSKDL